MATNNPEHYRPWGSAVTACGATEHQDTYLGTSIKENVTCQDCLKTPVPGGFKPGDRVELTGTFRCNGSIDTEWDEQVRATSPHPECPRGTVVPTGFTGGTLLINVQFDGFRRTLYLDASALTPSPPPATEAEIKAAIHSIQEAQGGQHHG